MRRVLLAVLAVTIIGVTGCGSAAPRFNAVDITGVPGFGTDFRLTDHTGKARTLADFRGKVVAVFFGFTFCPDVCPTTLSEMRQVMQQLGPSSEKLQVLFITVDPKRDTPELLAKYMAAFHSGFLALYGDAAATSKVTGDFKIVARIAPGKSAETYTVDHTAGTLIFDTQGRLRLMAPYGLGVEKLTADIKQLM